MSMLSFITFWWWFLCFPIVSRATSLLDDSNYHLLIENRDPLETLHTILNRARAALNMFDSFYYKGGFPNNLQASDRDFSLQFIYSLVEATDQVIFYGLEDGTFLGYLYSENLESLKLEYREPGEDGYSLNDNEKGEMEMSIHSNTCVDSETGKEQNCTLAPGDKYISCIDGCELTRCNDEESQITNCSSQSSNSECESKIKWCKNYETKDAVAVGMEKGYIPTTYHCFNSNGAISEKSGEVTNVDDDGKEVFGNCKFGSGYLVKRNVTGPFAQCQPNKECNTTFMGGYSSTNYDPRYRKWYASAKKRQKPGFSDVYVYANADIIGMTYFNPIYVNDANKNIFYGVLAVDLVLDDISKYLQEIANNTDHDYVICEDFLPYNMVGISTGTSLNYKICTDNQTKNEECVVSPLSINDLGNFGMENMMLQKAYKKLSIAGFVPNKAIYFLEEDGKIDSLLYFATLQIFEKPDLNLKWRIVTVWPLLEARHDDITMNGYSYWFILGIALVGFVTCLTLFLFFYKNRKERSVQLSDFQLTSAFLIGCAMINLSTLTFLQERTDTWCNISLWVPNILLFTTLSVLIVRMYRLYKLVGVPRTSQGHRQINNLKAWIYVLPIPLIELTILAIFSLANPLQAKSTLTSDIVPNQTITCERNEPVSFDIVQSIYFCLVVGSGCFLGYLIRDIDSKFEDVKVLLFAMYNIAFVVLIYCFIKYGVGDIDAQHDIIISAICAFIGTVFSSAAIIVPRLLTAKKERRLGTESNISRGNMETYALDVCRDNIHANGETLKILVCSSNMGNAAPTLSSMKAWIPEGGSCANIQLLDEKKNEKNKFHLIVIGMQEATWRTQKESTYEKTCEDVTNEEKLEIDEQDPLIQKNSSCNFDEDDYLASVEGEDTIALRKLEKELLGPEYIPIAQKKRGQMRLHIYAFYKVFPYIKNIKSSKTNTGVGNVMANKGGIVISLECHRTRFTFLSAHLAAHAGEQYYKHRCNNLRDILRWSKTFDLTKLIDVAVSSHHMFILGDLNFRTKIESKHDDDDNSQLNDAEMTTIVKKDSNDIFEKGNIVGLDKVLNLIEAKDWDTLYSYDELAMGLKRGDLLVDFQTLPCHFNPTFKVRRSAGFKYNEQRTPSYTDRILYRSAKGLHSHLKQLTYESCVDFITSDHKPIRGAFSVIVNDMIEPITLPSAFQLEVSEIECSDLLAGDVNGFSDPYVMFMWDSIHFTHSSNFKFKMKNPLTYGKWPTTDSKLKTLNPKWDGKKFTFTSTSCIVNYDAAIYLLVYDYDVGSTDDFLGILLISVQELISMKDGEFEKEVTVDRPLENYGKHAGRIKFKAQIKYEMGNC